MRKLIIWLAILFMASFFWLGIPLVAASDYAGHLHGLPVKENL